MQLSRMLARRRAALHSVIRLASSVQMKQMEVDDIT